MKKSNLATHSKIPVYRSVRVLIKEIIHDTISEKSEIEKAEERVLHHEDI